MPHHQWQLVHLSQTNQLIFWVNKINPSNGKPLLILSSYYIPIKGILKVGSVEQYALS